MRTFTSRPAPGRTSAVLTVAAAGLAVAFVVGPRMLAASRPGGGFGDEHGLAEAFRRAFAGYWSSGDRAFPPELAGVVDYWSRYHLAKAAIAAILLAVLAALGVRLWRVFLTAGHPGARATAAAAGSAVTGLALLALLVVMANLQGVLAPFSSLLPMLPVGRRNGELAEVRQRVADGLVPGRRTPTVEVLISDFARYHWAMVVIAALVAAALLAASVVLWRRSARIRPSDRRAGRLLAWFGLLAASLSVLAVIVAVANTTVALDPAPALLAFFNGGW